MYKALIVDDEVGSRNGVSQMLQTRKQWSICKLCQDGEEALKAIEDEPDIDLIITDIRMPRLDGLSLISQIRKKNARVFIIILTGYADFNYAKRALELRVYHYLLKPIDEQNFYTLIDHVEQALELRHNQNNIIQTDQDFQKFGDLLFAEAVDLPKAEGLSLFENKTGISLNHAGIFVFPLEETPSLKLSRFLHRLSAAFSVSRIFHYKGCIDCAILLSPSKDMLSSFLNQEQQSSSQPLAGFALCPDSTGFPQAFRQAVCAMKQNIYTNTEQIFIRFPQKHPSFPQSLFEKIKLQLYRYNLLDFNDVLYNFFDYVSEEKPNIFLLQDWISRLYQIGEEFARQHQIPPTVYEAYWHPMLISLPSLEAIQNDLFSFFAELLQYTNYSEDRGDNQNIKRIQEYLSAHYQDNLSLRELSDILHLSYNYLSTTYASITGETLIEFLTNIRMEKAKKLLINTNAKIREISEQVGYNDPKYFIRRFKTQTGVTPKEYRSLYKK